MVASLPKRFGTPWCYHMVQRGGKAGNMPGSRQDNPLDPPRSREKMPVTVRATGQKIEREMGGLG
jgi:hypothetical protein